MKKVLITGVTGQDGSYMVDYLLALPDIEVYGMVRRTAQIHNENYKHHLDNPRFKIVRGDLSDGGSIDNVVQEIQPDYFINFAAQSFVGDSWKIPEETFTSCTIGVLKCLEAIRRYSPSCRFYNAGSSEQFGTPLYAPQDEKHPFNPNSPYGVAKLSAQYLVRMYREAYGLYAVQGIFFNHESERRGEEFVTRKITNGLTRIIESIVKRETFLPIYLGNLDAKRDWSHAMDFMDAVWRMLNQEVYRPDISDMIKEFDQSGKLLLPRDINPTWRRILVKNVKEYVISSGTTHSVREFIEICLRHVKLDNNIVSIGCGELEKMVFTPQVIKRLKLKSNCLIEVDLKFYRPLDTQNLVGISDKIQKELGWRPKISFDTLAKNMLDSCLNESGVSFSRIREAQN